jgi:hypothetical protein
VERGGRNPRVSAGVRLSISRFTSSPNPFSTLEKGNYISRRSVASLLSKRSDDGEGREKPKVSEGVRLSIPRFTSSPNPFSTLEKGNYISRRSVESLLSKRSGDGEGI